MLASLLWGLSQLAMGESPTVPLDKAPIDTQDLVSLQKGAQLFMNYCVGCHQLKYVRYNGLGEGLGMLDAKGQLLSDAIQENLNFAGDKVTDSILNAMHKAKPENWFGIAPPDLSLAARIRGVDWLYTYLRSFYKDERKIWGVNNLVFPDVSMPHVLANLQGIQVPVYKEGDPSIIERLELKKPGKLSVSEYDATVAHIVNFLNYVGEPFQEDRKRLGVWVLLFLGVFFVFATLLKKEYWKDVH